MNELRTVSKLVKFILEDNKQSRNSDNVLYLKVLEHHAQTKDINLDTMTVPTFLLGMKQYGFPAFETVRQSRQKMQETYPELAPIDVVGRRRSKKEAEFREFVADGA